MIELPFDLSSADVIHDFLSAIYKHVMATLHRRVDRVVIQQAIVSFALTVPAIWSDLARKKIHDAATRAGMEQPSPLQIYSEPECAAVYALKDLDDIDSLRTNNRILVCDAGGGTVDVVTYEILQISPLTITECTVGTGDYCGSTFVDREFEDLFKRRMRPYQSLSTLLTQQAVRNFEAAKVAFRDDPEQHDFYVNLPGVGDTEEARVHSGNFHISREEMRKLFDPVIDRIINLISRQIKAVSMINSILLVGGFGESEYLYQRLLDWTDGTLIRILQPCEASTAIVRGAVIKGLGKAGFSKTRITRRARRWYGVTVNESFVEGKHQAEDRFLNIDTGQVLAKNQIRWFIRKVKFHVFAKLSSADSIRHRIK